MRSHILASCLALVALAPAANAVSRMPGPAVRDQRPLPVVRDHRSTPVVRDHRVGVRDHRSGASGDGVVVAKTPGAKRRPACVNNVCRDVTRN